MRRTPRPQGGAFTPAHRGAPQPALTRDARRLGGCSVTWMQVLRKDQRVSTATRPRTLTRAGKRRSRWSIAAAVPLVAVGGSSLVACGGQTEPRSGVPEAPASSSASTSHGALPACAATRVEGDVVRAGALRGLLVREYDVRGGRFRLRVGKYRDAASGLTQKIPWFVRRGTQVGKSLLLSGERLGPSPRTFQQTFHRTADPRRAGQSVFPSIIAPPEKGCWRLRFRSGTTTASLTVLVRE